MEKKVNLWKKLTNELTVEYEKSTSTIRTILKDKDRIILKYDECRTADRKGIKLTNYPLLEEAFSSRFKQALSHKNVVIVVV